MSDLRTTRFTRELSKLDEWIKMHAMRDKISVVSSADKSLNLIKSSTGCLLAHLTSPRILPHLSDGFPFISQRLRQDVSCLLSSFHDEVRGHYDSYFSMENGNHSDTLIVQTLPLLERDMYMRKSSASKPGLLCNLISI